MKYMYSAITLLVFAGLLGCQPEQPAPTAPATTTQQPAATPTDVQGGSQKGLVKADPATLPGCEPSEVIVGWDITSLAPKINDVEIYADGALFASGGSVGKQATGKWASPGTSFVMKSKVDGQELDRLTIGGPACH